MYHQLKSDPNVTKVDLVRVHCYSKQSKVLGIQSVYMVQPTSGQQQEIATECAIVRLCSVETTTFEVELGDWIVDVDVVYRNGQEEELQRVASNGQALQNIRLTTKTGRVVTLGNSHATEAALPPLSTTQANRQVVSINAESCPHCGALHHVECSTDVVTIQAEEETARYDILRRPRYALHDRGHQHVLSKDAPITHARQILASSRLKCSRTFSDFAFYQRLCAQPNCVRVDLKTIHCHYKPNDAITGVSGVYESTFIDGTVLEHHSQEFDEYGKRLVKGQNRASLTLDLDSGEYLVDLQTRQEKGVLTVITNQRTVFLGRRKECMEWSANPSCTRIVALAGSRRSHVLSRISYITETRNWQIAKPLVTMRALVAQQRANALPICSKLLQQPFCHGVAIQKCIQEFPDDIFRQILSFVVPMK